jgi:hypothetical protein
MEEDHNMEDTTTKFPHLTKNEWHEVLWAINRSRGVGTHDPSLKAQESAYIKLSRYLKKLGVE